MAKKNARHLQCCELIDKTADALHARLDAARVAFSISRGDFLEFYKDHDVKYDRIVMNPPFSRQTDIDHVLAAFNMLKPGGRLVAIMSAGVQFRKNNKTTAFRDFVEHRQGGTIEPLPAGSFKESGTMVNTCLVTVDK